jgi:hypothetical protein
VLVVYIFGSDVCGARIQYECKKVWEQQSFSCPDLRNWKATCLLTLHEFEICTENTLPTCSAGSLFMCFVGSRTVGK